MNMRVVKRVVLGGIEDVPYARWIITLTPLVFFGLVGLYDWIARIEVERQVEQQVEATVHLEEDPTIEAEWIGHAGQAGGISAKVRTRSLEAACASEPVQYILLDANNRRVVAAWVRYLYPEQPINTLWLEAELQRGDYILSLNVSPACSRRLRPATFESERITVE